MNETLDLEAEPFLFESMANKDGQEETGGDFESSGATGGEFDQSPFPVESDPFSAFESQEQEDAFELAEEQVWEDPPAGSRIQDRTGLTPRDKRRAVRDMKKVHGPVRHYIRWVQSVLNQVLGTRLPVDGVMGVETRRAIRGFQTRHGLPADGIVRPQTEAAFIAVSGKRLPQAPNGESELEYEIIGTDDRILVPDTTAVPFRFICCVESIFTNPGGAPIRLRGSGTLISDRHVLTAAHLVLAHLPQLGGRVRPASIMVSPGRNGTRMPFGASATVIDAARPRIRPEWLAASNAQFDFALLTLQRHLGAPSRGLGFWGHNPLGGDTRIRPIALNRLQNRTVNLSGYPIDKCLIRPRGRPATQAELNACNNGVTGPIGFFNNRRGTTQWRSLGHIVDTSPATEPLSITFDLDAADGHSGGPVWLNWEGFRNLVAVNTGGFPDPAALTNIIANMGVRITPAVVTQLRAWMRLDNVSANF